MSSETFGGARKALLEKSMFAGEGDGVIELGGGASRRVEPLPAAAGRVVEVLWRVKRLVRRWNEPERLCNVVYN